MQFCHRRPGVFKLRYRIVLLDFKGLLSPISEIVRAPSCDVILRLFCATLVSGKQQCCKVSVSDFFLSSSVVLLLP